MIIQAELKCKQTGCEVEPCVVDKEYNVIQSMSRAGNPRDNAVMESFWGRFKDTLRESVLKSRFAMERFCYEHGGKIAGGWVQNYPHIN